MIGKITKGAVAVAVTVKDAAVTVKDAYVGVATDALDWTGANIARPVVDKATTVVRNRRQISEFVGIVILLPVTGVIIGYNIGVYWPF